MLEYLIVGLIVVAAGLYVFRKYLPTSLRARLFGKAAAKASGCGGGSCGSATGCDTGCEPGCEPGAAAPADPARQRVVRIHPR